MNAVWRALLGSHPWLLENFPADSFLWSGTNSFCFFFIMFVYFCLVRPTIAFECSLVETPPPIDIFRQEIPRELPTSTSTSRLNLPVSACHTARLYPRFADAADSGLWWYDIIGCMMPRDLIICVLTSQLSAYHISWGWSKQVLVTKRKRQV